MSSTTILQSIADTRRRRIVREGYTLGSSLPATRTVPLLPFGRDPFIICEIKRRSPSKGDIHPGLDPVEQAGRYLRAGVRSVSVLTEESYFGGSLEDLVAVKEAYPELSLLRKDFLLEPEDLKVSLQAGADAVLLIAALLSAEKLKELYTAAVELGLTPLVEIHSPEDAAKASLLRPRPAMTGINSRDLTNFTVDRLLPLERSAMIDWPTRLVFESGVEYGEDIRVARAAGFAGVLIGETAVRHPERLPELVAAASPAGKEAGAARFWGEIARRRRTRGRPLVKVCGLTRVEDAALAAELGADLLGFVFADSPRRAEPEMAGSLGPTKALKVGVVALEGGATRLPPGVAELLASGKLDAIQFHGEESPEGCAGIAFPYYKALRVGNPSDLEGLARYRCPRVLIDARVAGQKGGTGRMVAGELAREAALRGPLWLAGGITPENAADLSERLRPELIDLSSGLESEPGKKDEAKMRRLFQVLEGKEQE